MRSSLAARTAALLLAAFATSADAAAKDEDFGVEGSLSIEQGYTDNVRGDNARRDGAWYTELAAEGEWLRGRGWLPHRIGGFMSARLYPEYDNRDYAVFGPWFGWDWKRVSFIVDYDYSPDRLRVDPATEVDAFADGHDLTAELRSKFGKNKRWMAMTQFQFEADFYDPTFRGRSFYEETVVVGLRCRATDRVTPRAEFAYSWRDAISSNFDREDAKLLVGFDVNLFAGLRGIFRFEKTWRNFLVGYESDAEGVRNNNFGREDDAYDVETGLDAPVPWLESTTVQLRYRHYDNSSSRETRSYDVNEGTLRISYGF